MVSLIIVDYKSISKTLAYIKSCYEHILDSDQIHVIIVDNNEDATAGMKEISKITEYEMAELSIQGIQQNVYEGKMDNNTFLYVCARENLGYAKGNNLGAEISALYYGDAYYLFSNNDMRIQEDFYLQQLIQPMLENDKRAVVGPKILGMDGKQQSPWKKSTAWKELFLNYYDLLLPKGKKITDKITNMDIGNQSKACYWVTGSFLMVDAKKFHQVGEFDENTFLYCEEMILSERLARYGYGMYFENSVTLIHEHGQTVKSVMSVLKGIRYSFQSSLYYYKQYRGLNAICIFAAKANFALFSLLFASKKRIAACYRHICSR